MIYWDSYNNPIIALNLVIVIGLFACLRLFSGTIAHIRASDELLRKDNPAFGISLAGATFGVTVMLCGTIYGSPEHDAAYSVISVGLFGIAGIAMMALTRVIFDRITLPALSLREEIVKGNVAVGIADAGNVLAAAIIIRAVLIWVTVASPEGAVALAGGYAVSQFLLTAMTIAKRRLFAVIHKGGDFQQELKNGNAALALRFAGRKIGAAFAIAAAAQIVVYEEYEVVPILAAWAAASVAAVAVWLVLSFVAERIILWRVDTRREVIAQRNAAVGALQAVIYISMGLLISSL